MQNPRLPNGVKFLPDSEIAIRTLIGNKEYTADYSTGFVYTPSTRSYAPTFWISPYSTATIIRISNREYEKLFFKRLPLKREVRHYYEDLGPITLQGNFDLKS